MKKGIVILASDFCSEWLKIAESIGLDSLGLHFMTKETKIDEYLNWLNLSETQYLIRKFEKAGIKIEHELHAMQWLLRRELFEKDESMFRFEGGKRRADCNCCISSADAQAIISERSFLLAKAIGQSGHQYYIWPDDSERSICHCSACALLSGSDQSMMMANAILRGLRTYDSCAENSYLAYADALQVPAVRPDDGLFLEFAPIHREHSKPITETSDINRDYCSLLKELLNVFDPKKTQILEYFLDLSMYCEWDRANIHRVPFSAEVTAKDISYYRKSGIESIKTFAAFIDKNYLLKFGAEEIYSYAKLLAKSKLTNDQ